RSFRDAAREASLERDSGAPSARPLAAGIRRASTFRPQHPTPASIYPPRMLRLLSIRNFAVVETLEVEFDKGFTVLTGETGAGKSILLDALSLLLGDRFEPRQLRPGAERAEIAAEFDVANLATVRAWLADNELDDGDAL